MQRLSVTVRPGRLGPPAYLGERILGVSLGPFLDVKLHSPLKSLQLYEAVLT